MPWSWWSRSPGGGAVAAGSGRPSWGWPWPSPGHSPTPSPSATQVEASPIPGTEVIDPAAHEVFAPAPATARPRLSAEEAWALFARRIHSHVTTIPANVTVRLGLLTFPIGPIGPGGSMEYHAKNLLVYGFSAPICGPRTHPVPAPNSTVSPPTESFGTCTFWYFLDANTARVIDQTTRSEEHTS